MLVDLCRLSVVIGRHGDGCRSQDPVTPSENIPHALYFPWRDLSPLITGARCYFAVHSRVQTKRACFRSHLVCPGLVVDRNGDDCCQVVESLLGIWSRPS
jgi:hypothetical protein